MHGRLLSLQRPKTCRLPKPANQAPLRGCQHFCLWTGSHLAPRAIPQKRGLRSLSPAESPICRPWKTKRARGGEKKGGNFYYFSLITKLQCSLTTLEITMNSTSADKQGRTGSSSSQFILSGFDVVWR